MARELFSSCLTIRFLHVTLRYLTLAFCWTFIYADSPPTATPKVEKFTIDGHEVTLKVPSQAAPGNPWLWVGEFMGHLESFENLFVSRGWHVAYVNVQNQFGSPRAMKTWEKLYSELRDKRSLSARPALLGISRGGLYVNAWTRLHPDRVSVLCLDNGVCDLRSWPAGFLTSKGEGSTGDWIACKTEFGFATDEKALAKAVLPTDKMAAAIENNVFLISVFGTADTMVPHDYNGKLLVDFWKQSGGRYKTFPKEGGGHHPHGLPDPLPLVELICNESK
jgi:pimeloyl-ACP methyl ester carboxylesterase